MQSRKSRRRVSKYDLTFVQFSVAGSPISETGCDASMFRADLSVLGSILDTGCDVAACAGDMCIFQTN